MSPSTAAGSKTQPEQQKSKLDDGNRISLLNICVADQKIYLDNKRRKALPKAAALRFYENSGNKHATLEDLVKQMVTKRQRNLD